MLSCRLQNDPPAEHLEAPPEPPALKRCVYGKVGTSCLILVCHVFKKSYSFDFVLIFKLPMHKLWFNQVDGEIVTLDIPNDVIKTWEKHDDFQTYYQEFLIRNPPSKTFKPKAGGKKNWNQQGICQTCCQEASLGSRCWWLDCGSWSSCASWWGWVALWSPFGQCPSKRKVVHYASACCHQAVGSIHQKWNGPRGNLICTVLYINSDSI